MCSSMFTAAREQDYKRNSCRWVEAGDQTITELLNGHLSQPAFCRSFCPAGMFGSRSSRWPLHGRYGRGRTQFAEWKLHESAEEGLALRLKPHRLKGEHVVQAFNVIRQKRGVPKIFLCDNGSEFTSQVKICGPG